MSARAAPRATSSSAHEGQNARAAARKEHEAAEPRWSGWARAAALFAFALGLLVWTWGRWPDVLIDFGGELYVPWRITQGDVLYRDLAYFTGPLSPYLNALWFAAFGTSLRTLVIANLVVLACVALLLYRVLCAIGGRWSAFTAVAVFFALCAFGQLQAIGNYNYVTPYSHETTHGALLALSALACLSAWLRSGRVRWIAGAGGLLGLAFLTKVEVFLATLAALALGLLLAFVARRAARNDVLRAAGVLVASACAPVCAAWALLASALGARAALSGTLGAWPHVLDARITSLPFYTRVMGTDQTRENALQLCLWAGIEGVALLALGGIALALRARATRRTWAVAAFVVVSAALIGAQVRGEIWAEIFRPLPLFTLLALAFACVTCVRARAAVLEQEARPALVRSILQASFAGYALVLLAKMILNARVQHYGFALAMPAVMLAIVVALDWIPRWIEVRGGNGGVLRAGVCGALLALVIAHLRISQSFLRFKTVPVGSGPDQFLADPRGGFVNAALSELARAPAQAGTLAVLPEGVLLNYLARRAAPARYINYMPPELFMFGEQAMVADFERRPPACIVLVHKDTSEYGLPLFGTHYGRELFGWVQQHYRPRPNATFGLPPGKPPLQPGTLFSVQVLDRGAVSAASADAAPPR